MSGLVDSRCGLVYYGLVMVYGLMMNDFGTSAKNCGYASNKRSENIS